MVMRRTRADVGGPTITELADLLNTTVRALRYYEQAQILRPDRDGANARRYGPKARDRAELIVALRGVGVPLSDIKTMTQGGGKLDQDAVTALLQAQVALAETQLSTLHRLLEASREGLFR